MSMQQDNDRSISASLGRLYLVCVLVHVGCSVAFSLLAGKGFSFPSWVMLVFSELTILVPSIIYILMHDLSFAKDLGFRQIRTGSFFMCILLAALVTPLVSLVNVVSQFFVSNTMVQESDKLVDMPALALIFLGGIYGPFCEEFLFRSIFFGRYEKILGPLRAGLISSLLFGLTHLNVNQAAYAFVLGFIFAVINRATGSVFPSMIIHMSVNIGNLLLLLAMASVQDLMGGEADLVAAAETARNSDILFVMAGVMLVMAIVSTAIAIPVTVWISKHEGHFDDLCNMFTKKYPRTRWLTVSMITALAFVLFIMFGLDHVLALVKGGV